MAATRGVFNKDRLLRLIFIPILAISILCSDVESASERPSFVVFIVDDLGIGDIGCFGNDTIKTPNIDRLASRGVKLNQNLSPESMCTPSRAATLTGRYAVRSGFAARPGECRVLFDLAMSGGLPHNETTVGEMLQESGYRTGFIGKWHLGLNCENNNDSCHNPLNSGFHEFYGLPFTNARGECTSQKDGATAVKSYEKKSRQLILATVALGVGLYLLGIVSRRFAIFVLILAICFSIPPVVLKIIIPKFNCILMRDFDIVEQPVIMENLTVRFTVEAKSFIKRNKEEPFLLFMSYAKVHTSLFTSPKFKGSNYYSNIVTVVAKGDGPEGGYKMAAAHTRSFEWRRFHFNCMKSLYLGHSVHGNYGDNVEEMDWSVGEIVSSLVEENLLANTMVYFTSDHGPHLEETVDTGEYCGGWRGLYRGGKGQSWEGGIRVPTIVMWKDHLPEGVTINEPTTTMDIFTTMTKLAGDSVPKDRIIDSKDILPLLKQEESVSPHEFMFHYCGVSIHAVRYRPREGNITWKAHFVTPIWWPGKQECGRENVVCACFGSGVTHHDPPLLYDITHDPYEEKPLDATQRQDIVRTIKEAMKNHQLGVKPVPSQLGYPNGDWSVRLQPCCNFPYCSCVEEA